MGIATRLGLMLVVGLFLLNIADGVLTLIAVPFKAEEVNPIAVWLLNQGSPVFLLVKIGGVAAALVWAFWRIYTGSWNMRVALPILSLVFVAMMTVVAMLVVAVAVPL